MKWIGPLVGMGGSLEVAARRYLDAADFDARDSGKFYATAHRKKLVGPMGAQSWPAYFTDHVSQDAGFDAVVKLTGTPYPGQLAARVA